MGNTHSAEAEMKRGAQTEMEMIRGKTSPY